MEAAKLVGKTSQDAILQKRCHRNDLFPYKSLVIFTQNKLLGMLRPRSSPPQG